MSSGLACNYNFSPEKRLCGDKAETIFRLSGRIAVRCHKHSVSTNSLGPDIPIYRVDESCARSLVYEYIIQDIHEA